MTSTIKEHLIAARALIDTPNKYEIRRAREGSAIASAFYEVGCDEEKTTLLFGSLEPFWVPRASHEVLMGVFYRAIAAQDPDRLQTREQMLRGLESQP